MATKKSTEKTANESVVGQTTVATSSGEQTQLATNEVLGKSGQELEQQVATYGDSRPTMVNGKFVGNKTFNDKTGEWEVDPDAAPAEGGVRAEDIFDRIGDAFPHETQRLVIEEIALRAGITAQDSQDLPDNFPTGGKSTASMRTDLTGRGAYAGGRGTKGPAPVAPGADGGARVDADGNSTAGPDASPAPAATDVAGGPASTEA